MLTSVVELREVVSYIRREREIVQRRLDVASAEVLRWKQQAEHALRSRDEIQETLHQEMKKQHEQVCTPPPVFFPFCSHSQSAAVEEREKHSRELLEQYNIVKESNMALRSQYEKVLSDFETSKKNLTEEREKSRVAEEVKLISHFLYLQKHRSVECWRLASRA